MGAWLAGAAAAASAAGLQAQLLAVQVAPYLQLPCVACNSPDQCLVALAFRVINILLLHPC